MLFLHRFIAISLLYLLFCASIASAVSRPGDSPVNITADRLTHDTAQGTYIAEGDVFVTDGTVTLHADRVTYHLNTGTAEAEGNVRLVSEGEEVSADAVTYAMESQEGTITNGTVLIKSRNLWIQSDSLEKHGENHYTAKRVRITTCDGDNPDWAISGRDLDLTIEGYGTVRHVMLETAGIPVVYTPFLLFPVKIRRQTGLLPLSFGYSSRKGVDIIQPLFVTLGDSMDATVYTNYMQTRGTRIGVEFRYIESALSKGIFSVDGFTDQKIDDGTTDNADYGYGGTPTRTNTSRYWLRAKADQALPGGFTAKLDMDWVSDQDYLKEFKTGPGGFTATMKGMESLMGRTIEDYTDTVRRNSLSVTKTTDALTASLSGIWNDNVIARSQDTTDTTLQQLPTLTINQSRSAFMGSSLQYSVDGGASQFYRQDLTSTTHEGSRTHILPTLYMPFKVGALSLDPRAGLRGLWWETETLDPENPLSGTQTALVPEFTTDISTEFFRIFNPKASWADKVRHRIKPTLTYRWQDKLDPLLYPTFDSVDTLSGKNEITLKIDSILTSKKGEGKSPTYRDFITGSLSQTWDIQEERETDGTTWRNGLTQQPFKPLSAEVTLRPIDALSLTMDATWSWYESELLTQNTTLNFGKKKGPQLSVSHRKKRDPLESIHQRLGITPSASYDASESVVTSLKMDLGKKVSLTTAYERDLLTGHDITKSIGLTYAASCWSLFSGFETSPDDTRIVFGLELTGLGGFESSYSPQ